VKVVSGKDFCKALERRGWFLVRIKSSHHHFNHPTIPGLISVPVHRNDDLKKGLQAGLMKLAGLTEANL
jgi:predicted RNA binding protein YcfA (HicA-like mRNA interferase family)